MQTVAAGPAGLAELIEDLGQRARVASRALALLGAEERDAGLRAMAAALQDHGEEILAANALDVAEASDDGLNAAAVDRLRLDAGRLAAMSRGVLDVVDLPDPLGKVLAGWTRPNGLRISKVRVPIGVVGIIYESRPNVTSDAAVLCLKAGNACILRGGRESLRSNRAIAKALAAGAAVSGLPADAVQLVPVPDREAVALLAAMDRHIDVIVPRGGHSLIEAVVRHARMPVIKHYHGVCHVYLDEAADPAMAVEVTVNAKCQRPGTCNALETLLVHRAVAGRILPAVGQALRDRGVELRGDAEACRILGEGTVPATEEDWTAEYLDLVLSIRVVGSLPEAVDHIERYGSHHSDAIITGDAAAAEYFLRAVDSAAVYWNASTRFTDGGEFGFGAEIGISTDKLHARGPMGLEELTTYKYVVRGEGQLRA